VDYKKRTWSDLVANADLQLSAGTCPLIEDEAIVWADKRIQELEKLNREMHVQVSSYLSGDDWSHWQKYHQHKFTKK
jgi:hypothetical protein